MKKRYSFMLSLLLIAASFLLLAHGTASAVLAPSQVDFPNSGLLVSADSVLSSLGEPNLVIIDARGSDAYAAAHIPGAINIIYGNYFTFGSGLLPKAKLNKKLGAAGLKRDMTFVIYDNTTASFGAAGRIFWMLEYLGCEDVHILDGGWDKWAADGKLTEKTINKLPAATFQAVVQPAKKAAQAHIAQRLKDKDFAIVDTRTDEEFIGWQLYAEARGGHIPRSIQIPYAWYFKADKTVLNYADLKTIFESRGVTQDKEVVTYCTCGIRSAYAYFLLRLLNYPMAANYDGSIAQWSATASLPMEKAERFSTIVHPSWVNALIEYHKAGSKTVAPPEYPYGRKHKYLIIESPARSTLEDAVAYKAGHIPGAVHSNDYLLEGSFPGYFLLPDDQLKVAVGNLGVTPDTTVVVYAYADSNGYAARLWWILKYVGVKDVRFLNGAYEAWTAAGYAAETTINYPVPVTYDGTVKKKFIATTDSVYNKMSKAKPMYIGDVRAYDEHIGLISGYSRLETKGRLPGSIWLQNGSWSPGGVFYAYGDADGTMRSYTEVFQLWKTSGIKSEIKYKKFDKELIFHCGNGYRSSWTLLYAYMMGYDNVRNYSNGWFDWSTIFTEDVACKDNPISPGWCQTPSGRPVETGPDL
ncbi:MAG: rhodanese-like domain-containing protein [Syntrophobacter sp.]